MRTALFGGTFDPPHRGHLAVAKAAAEEFGIDRILLAPTGRQPLKTHGPEASFADRLAMVRLLCAENATQKGACRLEASTIDAPKQSGEPNYTIEAIRQLKREFALEDDRKAEHRLAVIVGVDAFLEIRQWHEPEALLAEAEWIVVNRPGFSLANLGKLSLSGAEWGAVKLLTHVHETASSTEIRSLLAAGADCSDQLTPGLLEYIRSHALYGSSG